MKNSLKVLIGRSEQPKERIIESEDKSIEIEPERPGRRAQETCGTQSNAPIYT
jgi:hypothetical protein